MGVGALLWEENLFSGNGISWEWDLWCRLQSRIGACLEWECSETLNPISPQSLSPGDLCPFVSPSINRHKEPQTLPACPGLRGHQSQTITVTSTSTGGSRGAGVSDPKMTSQGSLAQGSEHKPWDCTQMAADLQLLYLCFLERSYSIFWWRFKCLF